MISVSYPREDTDRHTRTLANGKSSSRMGLTFSALAYSLLCPLRCVTLTHIWLDSWRGHWWSGVDCGRVN